ncbi:hypothetical protein S245_016202, partial [Arachis hypogaea]
MGSLEIRSSRIPIGPTTRVIMPALETRAIAGLLPRAAILSLNQCHDSLPADVFALWSPESLPHL